MQAILEQNRISKNIINRTDGAFGKKIGVFGAVFGCWHKDLSRPFTTDQRESYRACTECGARRRFDTKTLKTVGSFYYPPAIAAHKTHAI
jgi:DNA-directed RNA polymerase subunit RPC12/RpoP